MSTTEEMVANAKAKGRALPSAIYHQNSATLTNHQLIHEGTVLKVNPSR